MARLHGVVRTFRWAWLVVALVVPTVAAAGQNQKAPGQPEVAGTPVEMFQAIDQGQIEVKVIPKDSTEIRVLITNKTKEPLSVQLPATFAAVPALAQFGVAGGGGFGAPGGGLAGGGGVGGGGGRNGGMNSGGMQGMGGMGMMNIPPERVGKLRVPTVCLEHGKRDPLPAAPYVIKPLDSLTDRPAVHELCRMLGSGQLNQRAAQVAAWHLNNDMSLQELAAKVVRAGNGMVVRSYFSPQELQAGMQLAAQAVTAAQAREKEASAEKADSLDRP